MGHILRATDLDDQRNDFIRSMSSRRVMKNGLWTKMGNRSRGGKYKVVSTITRLRQSCGIPMFQEICSGGETKEEQEMDTPVLLKVAISITGARLMVVRRCCLRRLRACKSIIGGLMSRLAQALHLRLCSGKRKYIVWLIAARVLPILTPLLLYLSALDLHPARCVFWIRASIPLVRII
jgi:hypothetical protein